ncbi:LysR substrate-binding domain-containing protein [Roseateles sp. L2-2]|uniref:LysR substrate-binding domain-containing protein n=1 Tax=Roseateles sp. L2-2 TaxID=3422597 RepID=UPI003D3698E5
MELRQLRYLIGVADAGSLLKASKLLHLAQPALGQHIVALEEELGATLFVRSSRGMALTDNGRRFVEHARKVLAELEAAKASVLADGQHLTGEVILGLPTTVALAATVPLLRLVRARLPLVRLRIVESHSGFLREWLQTGRLELSILFEDRQEPWLSQRQLLTEQLVLVSAAGAGAPPLAREVPLRELSRLPMILPNTEHGLRRIIDAACRANGVDLDVVAEIDSLPAVKTAVAAGLAYTILSPGSVSEELRQGHLRQAVIRDPEIRRTICSCFALTRSPGPAARAVSDLVDEVIRELVLTGQWPATLAGQPVLP